MYNLSERVYTQQSSNMSIHYVHSRTSILGQNPSWQYTCCSQCRKGHCTFNVCKTRHSTKRFQVMSSLENTILKNSNKRCHKKIVVLLHHYSCDFSNGKSPRNWLCSGGWIDLTSISKCYCLPTALPHNFVRHHFQQSNSQTHGQI